MLWDRTCAVSLFFFSSRRRHTRSLCDWSSDVCSSDLRAVEASRVVRIEAEDYHRTAAAAPEIAVKVGEIARTRIGGLQSIASEPSPPQIGRASCRERV